MNYGIVTNDRSLAESVFNELEKELNFVSKCVTNGTLDATTLDGIRIRWVKPQFSFHGFRMHKVYIDRSIDKQVLEVLIRPMLCCSDEEIVWIGTKTVYQYLKELPRELFEATLMGLMDIPFNPEQEAKFHQWMDSPCEDSFSLANPKTLDNLKNMPTSKMIELLGRKIRELPKQLQDRMKESMKEYCEVCDTEKQAASTDGEVE